MEWFPNSLNDCFVYRVHAHDGFDLERSFTQAKGCVRYWNEYASEVMELDFAELVEHCFTDKSFDLHGISNISDQHAFVPSEYVEVEIVAPSGGDSVQKETRKIVQLVVIIKKDDDY